MTGVGVCWMKMHGTVGQRNDEGDDCDVGSYMINIQSEGWDRCGRVGQDLREMMLP